MRMTQKPVPYLVFPTEQQRQQREGDIMQRRGNGRRQEITTHQPGYSQRQQGLKSPEGYEPKKHSDRCTQGDCVGGILKLEELPSLVADPMDRVHNHQVTELYPAMKQRISGETDRGGDVSAYARVGVRA
jgi:hypothetical protein